MTNTMGNHIKRTENSTNVNLQKDSKKKQIEKNTQILNQVPTKHIEITASQQTPPTLSTTKTNQTEKTNKKINTTLLNQNINNSRNQIIVILMDSNRKFIDFRELLTNEIVDGGQNVVIPCGNVRKAEDLINSPKIIANQTLAYKISKSNIEKVSRKNLSPNYQHGDRHLKRNRSAGKTISGVELLCSNIYRALIGKAPEPGTLKKSLRYTHRNNRYMKSSFPYSRGNKYQTYRDGKSKTAKPTAPDLSGRLNNYMYPRYNGNNQNYMHTPTDRWYPLYQSCKMVSEV